MCSAAFSPNTVLPQANPVQSPPALGAETAAGYPKNPAHGLLPDRRQPQVNDGLAILQEVFSSVQGEGPWLGRRQIFVRVAHCPLACAYCDTPMTTPSGAFYLEQSPGTQQWHNLENPASPETVFERLLPLLAASRHHSLSLTGGEPLLYPGFAARLFQLCQSYGLKTLLETSGIQPEALKRVLPVTDLVSMDIKLQSSTEHPTPWKLHQAFAEVALSRPEAQLIFKIVVNETTQPKELRAFQDRFPYPDVPVYLQPQMSLTEPLRPRIGAQQLLSLQDAISCYFKQVLIIPQTHKWLGIC